MIERHALMTCDREHEDAVGPLYYFKLYDRRPGPYRTQLHRKAIIDVADDGTLAGVELIDDMPPPPCPADPPAGVVELLGPRCPDYDPDCASCLAHKQADEIEHLRKELDRSEQHGKILWADVDHYRKKNAELRAALKETLEIARRNELGDYVGRALAAIGDDDE